jgi:hypothetical protein
MVIPSISKKRERGSVIVESTLVMSTTLLMIFGSISLAIDCYQRISADSGAFFAAHVYALNIAKPNADAYETPARQASMTTYANNVAKDMMISSMRAQMKFVGVPNSGFSLTGDPTYFDKNSRHGGVSIVTPQAQQALVSQDAYGLFGSIAKFSVTGASIEPDMQIVNPIYDIAGNSSYAVSGGTAAKYFGTGMDQPPYYLSHNYLGYCTSLVWGVGCNQTWQFRGLGVAEYLNDSNWSGPAVSILDSPGSTPNVFSAMLCHQRVYAWTTQHFFNSPSLPAYGMRDPGGTANAAADAVWNETPALASNQSWTTYPFKLIYGWDAVIADDTSINSSSQTGAMTSNPLAGCQNVSF